MLRYVNDSSRMVYAIEMLPPPQLDELTTETDDITTANDDVTSSTDVLPNNMMSPSSKAAAADCQPQDVFSNIGSFSASSAAADAGWQSLETLNKDREVSTTGRTIDFEANILNNLSPTPTARWALPTGDFQENVLTSSIPDSTTVHDSSQIDTGVQHWEISTATAINATGNWDPEPEPSTSSANTQVGDVSTSDGMQNDDTYTQTDDGEAAVKTDQWRSCAICLEEMADSELMVHTICDGTLCQSCLEVQ